MICTAGIPSCAIKGPSTSSRCSLLQSIVIEAREADSLRGRPGCVVLLATVIILYLRTRNARSAPYCSTLSRGRLHSLVRNLGIGIGYLGSARTGLGAIRGYFRWRHSTNVISLRTARLAASFSAMMVIIFGETLFSSTSKTYSSHNITNPKCKSEGGDMLRPLGSIRNMKKQASQQQQKPTTYIRHGRSCNALCSTWDSKHGDLGVFRWHLVFSPSHRDSIVGAQQPHESKSIMLVLRAADTIARQIHAGESWISAEELRDLRQSPFVNLFLVCRRGRWSVAFFSKKSWGGQQCFVRV